MDGKIAKVLIVDDEVNIAEVIKMYWNSGTY